MSHVGNGEHDFDGLEQMPEQMREHIRNVRIAARTCIDNLEPQHINSWYELIKRLRFLLQRAEIEMRDGETF